MAKEETKTEAKKEVKPAFVLEDVYSHAGFSIKNAETGEALTQEQALVQLLNEVREVRRLLG